MVSTVDDLQRSAAHVSFLVPQLQRGQRGIVCFHAHYYAVVRRPVGTARAYYDHRALGVRRYLPADRTKRQPGEPATASVTDNHQLSILGAFDQCTCRRPQGDLPGHSGSGALRARELLVALQQLCRGFSGGTSFRRVPVSAAWKGPWDGVYQANRTSAKCCFPGRETYETVLIRPCVEAHHDGPFVSRHRTAHAYSRCQVLHPRMDS
ncbi:hypothetical protein GCM10009730_61850 [Streptomyces albidochromogenes]